MPDLPRRFRGRRLGLVVVLVLVAGALILVKYTSPPGSQWISWLGCSEGPLARYAPSSYIYPYGRVRSCQLLGREAPWFGDVDAKTYLLLDTERGAVAIRVDYLNHEAARQMQAIAVELRPTEVPYDLSADARTALEQDIDVRGGPYAKPWPLRYGDG